MAKENAHRLIHTCFSSLEEAAAVLREESPLLDERTGLGETPLHYLAVENHVDAVRFLHERGAKLNVRNDFGDSPLSEALALKNDAVVEYLLSHGADVHACNALGDSVLHAAVRGGDIARVPTLQEAAVGLGDPASEDWTRQAADTKPATWTVESTEQQIARRDSAVRLAKPP